MVETFKPMSYKAETTHTLMYRRQLCTLDSAETEQRVTSPLKTLDTHTHIITHVHMLNHTGIID